MSLYKQKPRVAVASAHHYYKRFSGHSLVVAISIGHDYKGVFDTQSYL